MARNQFCFCDKTQSRNFVFFERFSNATGLFLLLLLEGGVWGGRAFELRRVEQINGFPVREANSSVAAAASLSCG